MIGSSEFSGVLLQQTEQHFIDQIGGRKRSPLPHPIHPLTRHPTQFFVSERDQVVQFPFFHIVLTGIQKILSVFGFVLRVSLCVASSQRFATAPVKVSRGCLTGALTRSVPTTTS
jgi:hypothetical protein